jgi:pyruvate formate lyase activating enzyme
MRRAMLYRPEGDCLLCGLCAHHCRIAEGQRGLCRVRENRGGELYSLVYGRLVAENIDPIEKKPLFHLLPGTLSYSIATRGCNFRCRHCQNASISQLARHDDPGRFCADRTPEQVVGAAKAAGCRTISYTYVEPTIFFEFAYDCCRLAAADGIGNVFVSNGYMSEEATRLLAPVLTAINIDIKSFREEFYRKVCGAHLQPVLDSVRLMYELGVWVEVTTLLIPGHNDSSGELREIAVFLAAIDRDIPWHVTAFHPTYRMQDIPRTPLATVERAREIGLNAGLHHVYAGNIPGSGGEDTRCPHCAAVLIERRGFTVGRSRLTAGNCPNCGHAVAGRWQ